MAARKKTIGRNPLDALSAPANGGRRKGKKGRRARRLPPKAAVSEEIKDALVRRPGGITKWLKNFFDF